MYFYNLIDTTVFEFLYNEELQEKAFQEFIEKRKINFSVEELKSDPEKIRRFARYYNGDEIGYARKIEKLLRV
ncbi:lysozyme (Muramidase) (Lytic enzyme) (Protein P15) [Persephonella marina EX-H1]|uniref:Lysozyme (Muramidase) (Lytic enzyme) (Protein P15) n=1 Tax=Persephonella marina (strain DSM 14350 / EX-H1) TaxID=123214 RepID=C0QSE1_PERMH|nr:lysozyme (Muramidase) (Lytic enzyme) (Protein P15) [Persephonella marina EX-H1]